MEVATNHFVSRYSSYELCSSAISLTGIGIGFIL